MVKDVITDTQAASKDLQDTYTTIAVNYYVRHDKAAYLRQRVGLDYRDKVIIPAIQEVVKSATAEYTAEELVTKRPLVREQMNKLLQDKLDFITDNSIQVESFNIINFKFSYQFTIAIESKVTAEQDALKAKNVLEMIKTQADQKRAEASGIADAQLTKATAEAKAIVIQSEALKQSPAILQLRYIEKWDGKLPYTLINGQSQGILLTVPMQSQLNNGSI